MMIVLLVLDKPAFWCATYVERTEGTDSKHHSKHATSIHLWHHVCDIRGWQMPKEKLNHLGTSNHIDVRSLIILWTKFVMYLNY